MPPRGYDLGNAEVEVLRALWDRGPSTVRDVLTCLHERGRRVAYTTVQTLLTRLEQKGYVHSDKSDFAYVYRAKLTRNRLMRSRLKELVALLCDGTAGPLALQLIRSEQFTAEEIQALQDLIDRLDADEARRGAKKDPGGKGRKRA
ncbi:MAG: BlaI/MecI/CopY family transcriptional regulator [Planctomycetota bacterium]|nr:MAG: BlaI/MecI/CopY family transcriptional regulator [Planctomycetota bacterium]